MSWKPKLRAEYSKHGDGIKVIWDDELELFFSRPYGDAVTAYPKYMYKPNLDGALYADDMGTHLTIDVAEMLLEDTSSPEVNSTAAVGYIDAVKAAFDNLRPEVKEQS